MGKICVTVALICAVLIAPVTSGSRAAAAEQIVSDAPQISLAGCTAVGYLTLDVPFSKPVDYFSYQTFPDGSLQNTTDRNSALRVAFTFPLNPTYNASDYVDLKIVDDRLPYSSIAAYLPPDDADGVFTGLTSDYLLLGASKESTRSSRAIPTTGGSRIGQTQMFSINAQSLRLAGLWQTGERSYGVLSDIWLTPDLHPIYVGDKTAYQAAGHPEISPALVAFEPAENGIRCPYTGGYIGPYSGDLSGPGDVPGAVGTSSRVSIVLNGTLGGTITTFLCVNPATDAKECAAPIGIDTQTVPNGTEYSKSFNYTPPSPGRYCFGYRYIGAGPDDSSYFDPRYCLVATAATMTPSAVPSASASATETPTPTATPSIAAVDAGNSAPTADSMLVASIIVSGLAVLAAAVLATLLVRRRRRAAAGAEQPPRPADVGGRP